MTEEEETKQFDYTAAEPFSEDKPNLAVWEYQNTDEDFARCVALNVDALKHLPDADKNAIISIMDHTVKSITMHFNIVPKDPNNDNKITEDFHKLLEARKQ